MVWCRINMLNSARLCYILDLHGPREQKDKRKTHRQTKTETQGERDGGERERRREGGRKENETKRNELEQKKNSIIINIYN